MPDRSSVAGALLGTFVGDAIGRGFEGAPPVRRAAAERRLATALDQPELVYTDDTQLALALAEHLVDHPGVEPWGLAATMLEHYEPWRGYGGGMRQIVGAWQRGVAVEDAAEVAFEGGSFGNGAAMRIAPVGARWADDPDALDAAARRSARVTHTHPIGVDAAVAVARAVGRAAAAGRFTPQDVAALATVADTSELAERLHRAAELDADTALPRVARMLGNAVVAHRSVPAALWAAATGRDLTDTVVRALGIGGDADTIGAMAAAIRGAADGEAAIPAGWRDRLERGARGVDYALDVADRLVRSIR